MPSVNQSVLIAAGMLISAALFTGCDSKSKDNMQSDPVSGVPAAEQPNEDRGPDSPAGSADRESDKPGSESYDAEDFAADMLSSPGVWRVRRELNLRQTVAEWEALGNASTAGPHEKDLINWYWDIRQTGLVSIIPRNSGAEITECLSKRRFDTVDSESLTKFLVPQGYGFCTDWKAGFQKHATANSILMEQRCESGDSSIVIFDRLSESGTFYDAAISFTSNVLPNLDERENVCGVVNSDMITRGEAWDLLVNNNFPSGPYSKLTWYVPYSDGILTFNIDTLADFTVGEYQIGINADDQIPAVFAGMTYEPDSGGEGWNYRPDTGTVNILQHDEDGVYIEFLLEAEAGGTVDGSATLSF